MAAARERTFVICCRTKRGRLRSISACGLDPAGIAAIYAELQKQEPFYDTVPVLTAILKIDVGSGRRDVGGW